MTMTTALNEVESWSLDDRIEFVQQVWDRAIASGWTPELTEAQKSEFDRRLAALDANPDDVEDWESIEGDVGRWKSRA